MAVRYSLILADETYRLLIEKAAKEGMSVGKYINKVLREDVAKGDNGKVGDEEIINHYKELCKRSQEKYLAGDVLSNPKNYFDEWYNLYKKDCRRLQVLPMSFEKFVEAITNEEV